MASDLVEWYEDIIRCYRHLDGTHNFVPVSFTKTQWMKQATTLMCSHCLQVIELKDALEFNAFIKANPLETFDNA